MKLAMAMAVACLSVAGLAAGQDARAVMRRYELNIPKQSLDAALRDFALQTGLQIALFSDSIDGKSVVGPVLGSQSAEQASKTLLSPNGLGYEVVTEGTIAVLNPQHPTVSGPAREEKKKSFWGRFRMSQIDNSSPTPGEGAQRADQDQKNTASSEVSAGVAEDNGTKLEEVVVTAQKRVERLQDVPISIAALQGDDFEASGARGIADILNQVGGVNLVAVEPGRATISIRGAAAGGPTLTGSAPVGYYLDEIPFSFISNAILPDVNAFDLERVEVLRGPQGTLYGASSLNGVVRVLTQDADMNVFEVKGRTRFASTEHSENSYNGDLAVNVPVIPGKLGVRAVASYASLGGFISTATTPDFNDSEIQNYRLKVNAAPIEHLNIEFGASASRIDNHGPAGGDENYATPFTNAQEDKRDYEAYNLVAAYDFPAVSLQSSTGYIDLRGDGAYDFLIGGAARVNLLDELNARVFTEEVRFVSNVEGPWKVTGGVFYRTVDQLTNQAVLALSPFPLIFTDESEAFAVFSEVTRSFWDGKLDITGGLRYFEDTVKTTELSSLFTGTAGLLLPPVKSDFDAVTWRAVAAYHLNANSTLYTSIATGFRSGFNQAPLSLTVEPDLPPIDADELMTYEIGAKGGLLEGRLAYDAAVYYTEWDKSQQATLTPLGSTAIINSKSVSGAGIDASVTARLTNRFSLNANVGWNNLEFNKTTEQFGIPLLPKGERINMSPELTGSLGVEYRFPIGGGSLHGFFGGDARYNSSLFAHDVVNDITVDPVTGVTTAIPRDASTRSDDICIVGLRVGIEADHWAVTLFGENVTNQDGAVDPGTVSDPLPTRLRPRTIALQGTFRF